MALFFTFNYLIAKLLQIISLSMDIYRNNFKLHIEIDVWLVFLDTTFSVRPRSLPLQKSFRAWL